MASTAYDWTATLERSLLKRAVDIDFVALQLKTTSADFAGNNETSFYVAKFWTDLDLQDI